MRILILGGTGEARLLAEELVRAGHQVTTSLAGRTSSPQLPPGELRVGKFGGIPGLVGYLQARRVDLLVDATHPYAGLISINAVAAALQAGLPLVRFMRPAWPEPPGVAWQHVPDIAAAAAALPTGAIALVTTGHDGLTTILARDDCRLIVRLIEPPDIDMPQHAQLVLARPPYAVAQEADLLARHEVTHLLTKNSGGAQTEAKLIAAATRGVKVVMVARPVYGPAREVETLEAALKEIASLR